MSERSGLEWGSAVYGELLKKWPKQEDGEPVRPVFLKHCTSVSLDDEMTVGFLENCGIPCVKTYPNDGVFGKIVLGMPGSGVDIFVPETMLSDALELLKGEPDDE